MLLKIYLGLSIFSFIFNLLVSIYVARKFKRENPDIVVPKMPPFEKFMSYFRSVVASFIPIAHGLVILAWIFLWDNCVEALEDKIWDYLEANGVY